MSKTNATPKGRHVADPIPKAVSAEMFAARLAEVQYCGDLNLRGRHAAEDSWEEATMRVLRARLTLRNLAEVLS